MYVDKFDRTALKEQIARLWVGKQESQFGIQRITLKDGVIHVKDGECSRQDIFVVQNITNGVVTNFFINPDLTIDTQHNKDKHLEYRMIAKCVEIFDTETEFIERQQRWLKEEPWLQIDGLTPKEAVARLTELGW